MKTFLISYFYKGRLQQVRIAAENRTDAYQRLVAMRNTELDQWTPTPGRLIASWIAWLRKRRSA